LVIMKKLSISLILLCSCQPPQEITPQQVKVGCECVDGTLIIWNENLLKQTGWTTGNPCYDRGGIKSYIYR
jgi:hypothetical protein